MIDRMIAFPLLLVWNHHRLPTHRPLIAGLVHNAGRSVTVWKALLRRARTPVS